MTLRNVRVLVRVPITATSQDSPLNDIPTSPTQRELRSARDWNLDRDSDQEISYGSSHDTHNLPTGPESQPPVSMAHR